MNPANRRNRPQPTPRSNPAEGVPEGQAATGSSNPTQTGGGPNSSAPPSRVGNTPNTLGLQALHAQPQAQLIGPNSLALLAQNLGLPFFTHTGAIGPLTAMFGQAMQAQVQAQAQAHTHAATGGGQAQSARSSHSLHSLHSTSSSSMISSASSAASSASASSNVTVLQGGHTGAVRALALTADGSMLASGGDDGLICLWNTRENRLLKRKLVTLSSLEPYCSMFPTELPRASANLSTGSSSSIIRANSPISHPNGLVAQNGASAEGPLAPSSRAPSSALVNFERVQSPSGTSGAQHSNANAEQSQILSLSSSQPPSVRFAPLGSISLASSTTVPTPTISEPRLEPPQSETSAGSTSSSSMNVTSNGSSGAIESFGLPSASKALLYAPLAVKHMVFATQPDNQHMLYAAAGHYVIEFDTRVWRSVASLNGSSRHKRPRSNASAANSEVGGSGGDREPEEERTPTAPASPLSTAYASPAASGRSTPTPIHTHSASALTQGLVHGSSEQAMRVGSGAGPNPSSHPSAASTNATHNRTLGSAAMLDAWPVRSASMTTSAPGVSGSGSNALPSGRVLLHHEAGVTQVAINPAETILASVDESGYLKVLHLCPIPAQTPEESSNKRQRVLLSVKKHTGKCCAVCFRRPSNSAYLSLAPPPIWGWLRLSPTVESPTGSSATGSLNALSMAAPASDPDAQMEDLYQTAMHERPGSAAEAQPPTGLSAGVQGRERLHGRMSGTRPARLALGHSPLTGHNSNTPSWHPFHSNGLPLSIGLHPAAAETLDPVFLSAVERAQLFMQWQLFSGGEDSKIQLVEFERRGRSLNIFDMSELLDEALTLPPSVHPQQAVPPQVRVLDIAITPDGTLVACALDNGFIGLFDATQKNLVPVMNFNPHNMAVSRLLFLPSLHHQHAQAVLVPAPGLPVGSTASLSSVASSASASSALGSAVGSSAATGAPTNVTATSVATSTGSGAGSTASLTGSRSQASSAGQGQGPPNGHAHTHTHTNQTPNPNPNAPRYWFLLSSALDCTIALSELRVSFPNANPARIDRHHANVSVHIKSIQTVEHWQRVHWCEARSIERVFLADATPNITVCNLLG